MKWMRHFGVVAALFIAAALSGCVTAPGAPANDPVVAPAARGAAFLYRIASPRRPAAPPSYLFGTVHVAVDARRDLPETVWDAFRAARCYVMEADTNAIDRKWIADAARAPAGQSLKAMLPKTTWAKLAATTSPAMPEANLDRVAPWFAALLYMQASLPRNVEAMDEIFFTDAQSGGKKIYYLEDWKAALVALKDTTDVDDLIATVDEPDDEESRDLDALLTAYRGGDEKTMARVLDEESRRGLAPESATASLKALLDDRNAAWEPRLEADLADGACFVAVGAGHLLGVHGLIQSLKKAEFTVERVEERK